MNLYEAVEIQEQYLIQHPPHISNDFDDAIRLSIEAIKVLLHGRLIGAHHDPACLPGETND